MKKSHEDAFSLIEDVYKKHYLYLKRFLLKITSDEKLIEDVIQEVFSKMLLNPEKILEVKYIRSWLMVSTRNLLIDHFRKKKPHLLNDEEVITDLLITDLSPEKNLLLKSSIDDILKDLSKADKTLLLAKEYYGYTYEEISVLLNIPISTIKSRIFRLKKRLISRIHRSD
ncbi:RNA polymerase sigma factor, sigma-70 family protein [Anoxybacillus sp. B7M1]|jgi:RNA polymerase sigma-70 factor, ECF subfamily|uniref:RNA polymerase sigma factor n=1 Tax=unclassified Anoxybacillus TaxID=2639704 RepID=UPI0005CD3BB9|nr:MULTISPECIES: RNA polymerase sigma factor [unclassified Anoxybacillus]ANB57242.1 RNA polymerase sigma factor, sigma-70 family protein [Anoxybacillus sp. B2M1]ANB62675.1 RNA polymerase sigma factor, sigma-70 family protein [Anoxybacillus sp. B7M1]